jgi:MFS family permease
MRPPPGPMIEPHPAGTAARLRTWLSHRLLPMGQLPVRARWLLASRTLSGVGQGLVLPFVIVYLRDVRHLPLSSATLVIAITSATALAGGLVTGSIIDRTSAASAAVLSLGVAAAGCVMFAFAADFWSAVLAGATLGIGTGGNGGAWNSLIAESVSPDRRTNAFGISFAALNASIGLGGLIGGLVVTTRVPSSFQLLYLADAVTLVVCALQVAAVTRLMPLVLYGVVAPARGTAPARPVATGRGRRGYLAVLTDRLFAPLMLLVVLLNMLGYAQLSSALPAYATRPGGIAVQWLALVYACNTLAVIVLQIAVLPVLATVRRTTALAATSIAWAATWLLVLLAGAGGSSLAAALGFLAAASVFALGEVLYAPTIPALVNDIATDEYRGRYNSAGILATTVGMIIGPLVAGAALQAGLAEALFAGLAIGCGLMAPVWLRLSGVLPAAADGRRAGAGASRQVMRP